MASWIGSCGRCRPGNLRSSAVSSQTRVNPITYRVAYGTEFLYVYIEAEADHLTYRDRAFQNGDGFLLLLGKPQPNNGATDEFYELACGAVNTAERIWQKRIFWNYNVDKVFVPTSLEDQDGIPRRERQDQF